MLELENFGLKIGEREILADVNIKINEDEKCLLLGPNGIGKTAFLKSLMGFPPYSVVGKIIFNKEDITSLPINERFKRGIFLLFQDTEEINVRIGRLLKLISSEEKIEEALKMLNLSKEFLNREINKSLSGGERKTVEMLQMLVSSPKLALIDEFDAGVDFSLLKTFTQVINSNKFSAIIVTHNYSTISMLKINRILLLKDKNIREIDKEELERIVKEGYGQI
ncbi:MAG: ATP-binding cassette domain-containing protein [Candidatus Rehaiarchaeum fermentans]|nr:ATP-binding cassette domain-containing protein [Candidatus Rehaiarchaeum fermentans]MCW1293205.1 ATP-binding cassette domain-containing protein [Candidatus Rehaiarchaeum fermentans]MCW1293624.1 ATP-binding cassette domain-containing protein [Candidatus Rehaiarchaeum fermentans]MCW1302480.1 ATP-binding cassette domain-containing protein [Candidatus Rehaiarchaeum fermentans]MCW1311574.1 ATP-binding cassette domain-containing protein [Candidatus Rehaiarchaeum fermentans]